LKRNSTNTSDWQIELPAKRIAKDFTETKEIIFKRIENNFYNLKSINEQVIDKLISTLLNHPKS